MPGIVAIKAVSVRRKESRKNEQTDDPSRRGFSHCICEGPERPEQQLNGNPMKNATKTAAALALMSLLAGCVVTSVYPFYTAKDVVFDPALVGVWGDNSSTNAENEHWRFEKMESQAYLLTVQDKEKRTEFDARLFKLNGKRFLDVCPRERPDNSLPLHYLLKVTRIEPALEMNLLDYDWLKKLIEKDPKVIRHIVVAQKLGENGEGDLVLTAETAELQKFILKHEKTPGAFGEDLVMKHLNN